MKDKIIETVKSTVAAYESSNHLDNFWKEPIVEIISAKDERLKTLKEAVSIGHLMPHDILSDAKSIVSFFIPFQENIVKSNIEGPVASKEWVMAYIKTNDLLKTISEGIETLMEQNGYKAGKIPATHNFDAKILMSNWSHRHIAFLAGIGTFGANNMLITKNGCCGRLGSIIINYEFSEYRHNTVAEKCLNKKNGTCGICQKKCFVNAYENNIFDRHKCYKQCIKNDEFHKTMGNAHVCGKCLVGLPCSTMEP